MNIAGIKGVQVGHALVQSYLPVEPGREAIRKHGPQGDMGRAAVFQQRGKLQVDAGRIELLIPLQRFGMDSPPEIVRFLLYFFKKQRVQRVFKRLALFRLAIVQGRFYLLDFRIQLRNIPYPDGSGDSFRNTRDTAKEKALCFS